jgi:hypothetical protein
MSATPDHDELLTVRDAKILATVLVSIYALALLTWFWEPGHGMHAVAMRALELVLAFEGGVLFTDRLAARRSRETGR